MESIQLHVMRKLFFVIIFLSVLTIKPRMVFCRFDPFLGEGSV